jgi:hypothetical protein
MSAPVTERPRTRTATIPAQRVEPDVRPRRREKDTAAKKAYARRDDRLRRLVEGLQPREGATAGRAQFVLLVMVLLAVGMVATLWLSTAATADSYVLQQARDDARQLREQSERLHRDVAAMDSAPELARRAGELGMVPVQDPPRLVVAPDGSVTVVGTPKAVVPPPPPVLPSPPGQQPVAQTEGGPDEAVAAQDGQAVPGQAPDATQPSPSGVDAEAAGQDAASQADARQGASQPRATQPGETQPGAAQPGAGQRAATAPGGAQRAGTPPATGQRAAAPTGAAQRPGAPQPAQQGGPPVTGAGRG